MAALATTWEMLYQAPQSRYLTEEPTFSHTSVSQIIEIYSVFIVSVRSLLTTPQSPKQAPEVNKYDHGHRVHVLPRFSRRDRPLEFFLKLNFTRTKNVYCRCCLVRVSFLIYAWPDADMTM